MNNKRRKEVESHLTNFLTQELLRRKRENNMEGHLSILLFSNNEYENQEKKRQREERIKKKISDKINIFIEYLLSINNINAMESSIEEFKKININVLGTLDTRILPITITLLLNRIIDRKKEFSLKKIIDLSNILFFILIYRSNYYQIKTYENSSQEYNLDNFNLIPTNKDICYQDRLLEFLLINQPSFYRSNPSNIIDIDVEKNERKFKLIFNLPVVIRFNGIKTLSPAIDLGGISQIFFEQIQDELNKINFLRGNINYIKKSYNNYPLKIKIEDGSSINIIEKIINLNKNKNILSSIKMKNIYQIMHIINTIFLCSMSIFNSINRKKFYIKISENSDFYKFIMYYYFKKITEKIPRINLIGLTQKEYESLFAFFLINHDSNDEMSKLLNNEQRRYILEGNSNSNIPNYIDMIKEVSNIPFFSDYILDTILEFYGYSSIETFINFHMTSENVSIENKDLVKNNINILLLNFINQSNQKKNKIKAAFDRFIDLLNQKELDIFCSYISGTKKLTNYNINIYDIDPNVVQTSSSGRTLFTRPFASHTCFNTLDLNINISAARNNTELEELVFNFLSRPKSVNNGNSEIRYQLIYAFSKSENFGIA